MWYRLGTTADKHTRREERCASRYAVTVENQKPWNETIIREIQKKTGKKMERHSARMTLMDKRLKFSF